MEIRKYTSPFECDDIISLWEEIFGEAEAELERVQLDGSETEHNTDIVYAAYEDDILLGTVHITIAKKHPDLCGVSGVCTTNAARGKGISKVLFKYAMDEADSMGVKAAFLGTGNPYAIKVYTSNGFIFIPCTGAMARVKDSDFHTYTKNLYSAKSEKISICRGSPDVRLPIIPLAYCTGGDGFLDVNAGIVGRGITFSQVSCMGLFQKYLDLEKSGGKYCSAANELGTVGAMASAMKTDRGLRADFFCVKAFESAVPQMIDRLGADYLQISDADEYKQQLAEQMGYKKTAPIMEPYRACIIPMHIYER